MLGKKHTSQFLVIFFTIAEVDVLESAVQYLLVMCKLLFSSSPQLIGTASTLDRQWPLLSVSCVGILPTDCSLNSLLSIIAKIQEKSS